MHGLGRASHRSAVRWCVVGVGMVLATGCASPPDRDADGVHDEIDNCVEVFNPTQYDRDGDGKGHACDLNVYLRAGTFDPLGEEERYLPDLTTDEETGYFYLQGYREADPTADEHLAEMGIEVVDYFDGEVYVVRSSLSLAELRSLDWVRAAGIYQPANRIEPELIVGRYLAGDGTPLPELGTIRLEVWVYRDPDGVAREIRRLGGSARPATETLLVAELPGERLPELLRVPDVNLVMPRTVVRTESDYVAAVTHVAELAETYGLTGAGEVITIADSGLDSGDPATLHPDLAGRLLALEDWGTGTAADLTGHGTHVAGVAVGTGAASEGLLRGAAPEAGLRFQAVGRPVSEPGAPAPEPVYCFGRPKLNLREKKTERPARKPMELAGLPEDYTRLFSGATIHSNSWGSCQSEYTPRVARIDQFLVDHPGVTVLFAAGNDADHLFLADDGTVVRRGGDSLTNTARAKNAITVGATGTPRPQAPPGSHPERVTPFSGKGELASGRIKPDLVAPGQYVLAARSRACLDGEVTATVLGDELVKAKPGLSHELCVGQGLPARVGLPELGEEYMLKSGTSMATPHVGGLVALVREWLRRHHGYRQPSSALVRALLINGAVDLPDQEPVFRQPLDKPVDCTGYPNPCEGWGRVDAGASLYPGGRPGLVQWVDRVPLGRARERRVFAARFDPEAAAAITLVWADPPPETLQNDLDLVVVAPDGTRYLGNTFAPGGGSWPDPPVKEPRLNNNVVEKVVIPAPESGTYRVEVVAARLRRGPQPFALVASPATQLE